MQSETQFNIQTTRRPRLNLTRSLKHQNEYTLALTEYLAEYAFDEERAPLNKGKWRSEIFIADQAKPLDLELGTGNGKHFAFRALQSPERLMVGLEIKYKPLIQTIKGALRGGAQNAKVCRFHAFDLPQLFEVNEINNVYIHFPDPWVTPRKPQNRFVSAPVLNTLHGLQRDGSFLDFKTDSLEYFEWALNEIPRDKYKVMRLTFDLHKSEWIQENFVTQFESIFLRQNIKINYLRLQKI